MKETPKIALVTGGSRGLGKDMALNFARKGTDVILTYCTKRNEAENIASEITNSGRKAAALYLDMSDLNSYDAFVTQIAQVLKDTWGVEKFDYLVNNAGIGASVPFTEISEELFDRFMNIHFKGVFFLTQKLLPYLNNNGSIVNISTGTTRFTLPGYAMYAPMKAAVEVLSKYMAKELGPRRIRVNVVAPGPVETDFNNAGLRNSPPERRNMMIGNTPLGRLGQPDDIGSVVAFLCSEDAKWINGQRIEVAGGINL
jgi:NAD(P)-dependent dehydrogenase (short-subunit alcohol dehydrogenase family)